MDNFKCYRIHCSILKTKPKLKDELINMLKNMFKLFSKQGMFAHIIQLILWGIFENIKLELQKDCVKCGQFKVTLECTWNFVNDFIYWVAIIVLGKLPPTWEQESTTMAHTIAYLVKMYNIFTCLAVNTIQIEVHLVPIGRCWTWETKWDKHVQVLGT